MRFTLDMHDGSTPPPPGDVLRPIAPRRAWYVVERVEPVESRVNPHRWRLEVRRTTEDEAWGIALADDDHRWWPYS